MKLPVEVDSDLKPYHKLEFRPFQYLRAGLPDAQHISLYPKQFRLNCMKIKEREVLDEVNILPSSFGQLSSYYHNRTLIHQTFAEAKEFFPAHVIEGECGTDDKGDLAAVNGGALRSGSLVLFLGGAKDGTLTNKCSSHSGVVAKRGDQLRLTVAAHPWDTSR